MNDMIPGFVSPYQEWVVAGRELVERNPDATLWDLIVCMYEYKTGCEMKDLPSEDKIVQLHMDGYTKSQIAERLECSTQIVNDVLESIGFKAFRVPPDISPIEVRHAFRYGERSERDIYDKLSRYMAERCIKEADTYGEYLNERREAAISDT